MIFLPAGEDNGQSRLASHVRPSGDGPDRPGLRRTLHLLCRGTVLMVPVPIESRLALRTAVNELEARRPNGPTNIAILRRHGCRPLRMGALASAPTDLVIDRLIERFAGQVTTRIAKHDLCLNGGNSRLMGSTWNAYALPGFRTPPQSLRRARRFRRADATRAGIPRIPDTRSASLPAGLDGHWPS